MGAEGTPPVEISQDMEDQIDALLEAARYDDLDDLKGLESAGVSLDSKDSQGRTALHMAAANGHHGIVNYFISKGVFAQLKREYIVIRYVTSLGTTMASEGDLNALNEENNTPLHWACLNGHVEVVKTLILAGANVSALNSHDQTPIDEALSKGKMEVFDAINAAVAQVELTQARVS